MAERLKDKILEKESAIDIVTGPDAYWDLPNLIHIVESNFSAEDKSKAINVQLS